MFHLKKEEKPIVTIFLFCNYIPFTAVTCIVTASICLHPGTRTEVDSPGDNHPSSISRFQDSHSRCYTLGDKVWCRGVRVEGTDQASPSDKTQSLIEKLKNIIHVTVIQMYSSNIKHHDLICSFEYFILIQTRNFN